MSEQLSPEQASTIDQDNRAHLLEAAQSAQGLFDASSRYGDSTAVEDHGYNYSGDENTTDPEQLYEAYEREAARTEVLDNRAKDFYAENKDAIHEAAIVERSAQLYGEEKEARKIRDDSFDHITEDSTDQDNEYAYSADVDHEVAVHKSNEFAKDNIDVLHEAANRVAESMQKE